MTPYSYCYYRRGFLIIIGVTGLDIDVFVVLPPTPTEEKEIEQVIMVTFTTGLPTCVAAERAADRMVTADLSGRPRYCVPTWRLVNPGGLFSPYSLVDTAES